MLQRVGSLLQCVGFSLVVACGFSLSSCGEQASGCMGSVVVARGLSCPAALEDLSSPTRDRTRVPCIGRQIIYHWTTSEVPGLQFHHPHFAGEKTEAQRCQVAYSQGLGAAQLGFVPLSLEEKAVIVFVYLDLTSVGFFCLFFCFWPLRVACVVLVPQPGIEPQPLAVKAPSPNHWTAREVLTSSY